MQVCQYVLVQVFTIIKFCSPQYLTVFLQIWTPLTSKFPSALEMSLGLRPWDISGASGNLLGVGDVQPNTSLLLAVYVYNPSICLSVTRTWAVFHIED